MRKYWKRILAMVLAVAMIVPSVPMEANASAWSDEDNVLEVKRGDEFSLLSLKELIGFETVETKNAKVDIPYDAGYEWNGEWKSLKTGVAKDVSIPYAVSYFVDDYELDNENSYMFEQNGTYSIRESNKSCTATTVKIGYSEILAFLNDPVGYAEDLFFWKNEQSVVIKEFQVKLYDELIIVVKDKSGKMSELPSIEVNDANAAIDNNTYKVYSGNSDVTIEVPTVDKYKFTVEGADSTENSSIYSIGGLTEGRTVTITYEEVGASSLAIADKYEGIAVNANGNTLSTEKMSFSAGTEVSVSVNVEEGFLVETAKLISGEDTIAEATEASDGVWSLNFTTSTVEEKEYVLEVSVINKKNTVLVEAAEGVVTVDEHEVGTQTILKGSTVSFNVKLPEGHEATAVTVKKSTGEEVAYTMNGNVYSFAVDGEAEVYTIQVLSEDKRSTVALGNVNNASVTVNGSTLNANDLIYVLNGSTVTVKIKLEEGYCAETYSIENGKILTSEYADGVLTVTFKAGAITKYSVNVDAVKVITAKEEADKLNIAYVIAMFDENNTEVTKEIVEQKIWDAAFETVTDEIDYSKGNIEIEYLAGTIEIPKIGIFVPATSIPVYSKIDEKVPTVAELKAWINEETKINLDDSRVQGVCQLMGINLDEIIANALSTFHTFGDNPELEDSALETVRAKYNGSLPLYSSDAETNKIIIEDTRIKTVIKAADEVKVTYGAYNTDSVVKETALADSTSGVYYIDENGKEVKLTGEYQKKLTLVYGSVDTLVGADVGEYSAEIKFPNTDIDYKSASKEVKIIVEKADSYTNVSEANVKYGTEVNASALIDTGKADRVELAVGLSIGENASEDLGSVVYLNLPMLVDLSILDELGLSSLKEEINKLTSGKEITISELGKYLSDITGAVEGLGSLGELLGLNIDETAINTLTSVLENLENIEGVGDIKLVVSMGQTLKLKDSGAYLVGAVVTDSNYNTSFGANYVVITPDGYKAVLDWNVKDDNGLVRKDALATYDFGAKVVEVSEGNIADAQAHVTTFFMGVDANGEATVTYNPKELQVGVYTQIALIKDLGNTMYYAEPIQRVFAVVPQVAEIEVKDAEKVYTGKPQEAEVAVKLADGSEYDPDCLQITYVGLGVNGEVYNSVVAPTNTGAYTVLATYLEKDANGVYDHAGFDVGYMVISPAEAELDVEDNAYAIYDGNEHWPTITNTKNLELVKIVADDKGNVNVILPSPYDKEKYELNAKDAADELVEILKDIYANNANVAVMAADEASANEIMNEVISRLEAIGVDVYEMIAKAMDVESIIAAAEKRAEEAMKAFMATDLDAVKEQVEATLNGIEVKNLSINGVGPIEEGVYTVSVIGYRENYKLAAARGSIEIHEHDWVAANCTTPKTCEECKETEGEALGHTWGEWYVTKKPTKHSKGEERRDCENCEVYQLRELAKLPSGGGSKHDKDDSEAKLEGVYYAVSEPVTITPAKTGDSANVIGYACAVVAAGAALLYVFLKKKRA